MRRSIILTLLLCLLATPALAIMDLGHPAVTRLWVSTENGNRFACTGFYIRPLHERGAWLVSAGHCAGASLVARSAQETSLAIPNWRVVIATHAYADNIVDLAVASLPDLRENRQYYSFLADRFPDEGARLYIHGFPGGVETIVRARAGQKDERGMYQVHLERAGDVLGGSSGSPVLDADGFIVGVLWGIQMEMDERTGESKPTTLALVTPVEALHAVIEQYGLHVK